MPGTIALLYALMAVLVVGVIVFLTGVAQVLIAQRRKAALRAPLVASGIGFAVALAAAISIGVTGALHTETFVTYSSLH